jgi:tRNA (adenine57-N1/adenine58-N1)-methyltransferase
VKLQTTSEDGYAEGAVTNTRFGSFPHTTLIGLQWGSQVRASKVDTGSRGRKSKKARQEDKPQSHESDAVVSENTGKKRKSLEQETDVPAKKLKPDEDSVQQETTPKPIEAGSGFVHILQPTPESWTSSLDHRTQVVYTPDYSYILQRLRVRPGSTIIEAGAGSGSFTHAAVRAVFNGYPDENSPLSARGQKPGRVCSYEYHEPRVEVLRREIAEHALDGVVQLTHRDVCNDGFNLADGSSPKTDAIFLDLPAPWQALKHLTRAGPNSPLNPDSPIHICSFSPCIEQVMATVSALRKAGWTDISMVEVQQKRVDVRRERVGLKEEGLRGVNATAANVDEAVQRLREDVAQERKLMSKQQRIDKLKLEAETRKLYNEGQLAHRSEPDVKTHTSYLVFAVLTREWTEEDEKACEEKYKVEDTAKEKR